MNKIVWHEIENVLIMHKACLSIIKMMEATRTGQQSILKFVFKTWPHTVLHRPIGLSLASSSPRCSLRVVAEWFSRLPGSLCALRCLSCFNSHTRSYYLLFTSSTYHHSFYVWSAKVACWSSSNQNERSCKSREAGACVGLTLLFAKKGPLRKRPDGFWLYCYSV